MCFGGHGGGFCQIFELAADITASLPLKHKKFAGGTIFLDTTILTCATKVDLVLYK
jgi:hypothetical protein